MWLRNFRGGVHMKNGSHKLLLLVLIYPLNYMNAEATDKINADPHRSQLGFFDIHICNWPNRTNYFKALFGTEKYDQISSMDIFTPENKLLVRLDKNKFRTLKRKNKPNKKVFIVDLDVPNTATTGWYSIRVKTKKGEEYEAKDYVVVNRLKRASDMQPNRDKRYPMPITLNWKKIVGAQVYQVFVRDEWTGKLVFKTKLISENKVTIPIGKLESGGDYSWRVHSRDVNEHVLLGDFNMGSMSEHAVFSVNE